MLNKSERLNPIGMVLGIQHIEELPALQWKLLNLSRMDKIKRQVVLTNLETLLAS